ncbi:hypothetical protein [Lentzea indica]|uniref:hypothetical protein n=1 Tax=Lentzea indica TaxID=2604800 RepID=UPI00143A6492|nr:hypothetical protein [Lentzea indica]
MSTFDGHRVDLMTNGFNMPIARGAFIGLVLGPWDHSYDALRTTVATERSRPPRPLWT